MTLHLQPDKLAPDTSDSTLVAASPPNDAPPDFSAFDFALQRYNRAPIAFVREVLLQEPDAWQIEALRGFARGFTRHSIKSGHGVGKSCLAAWVVLWFICTRAPFKCALTAPSAPQLFDVLWPELLKWMGRMPEQWQALWDVTADHITLKSDKECFVTARTSRPETPEAMAGLHSRNILLVADEASGIDEKVFEAASGSMSSSGAITLLIGNPTRDSGFFWRTHTLERDRWRCMTVSSAESTRVSPDYITEMSERYGPESNAYRVRVLGQFPSGSDAVFIPGELVDSAMNRDTVLDTGAPIIWGLDCARFGADASVLIKRQGSCVTEPPRRWRNIDLMVLAGAVKHEFDLAQASRPSLIAIDSIGIGAGVVDRLQEQGLPVLGINVSESPANAMNFMRLRDELWSRMREWLATRTVRLPRDDQMRDDLVSARYTFSSTGKLQIESKESMRRRGLPSCDSADALMLTLAQQGLMVTSANQSWMFDTQPVMPPIAGME
jgi:phage terminase large subunit